MTVEQRLTRLEWHNRMLTYSLVGLLIIAAGALLIGNRLSGEKSLKREVVVARAFAVVNEEGQELVRIGESEVGSGALTLMNPKGSPIAALAGTADELGGSLCLYDGRAAQRIILGNDKRFGSGIIFADSDGGVAARLGDVGGGRGSLDIYDRGRHVAFLCVDPNLGSGNLTLYDPGKRILATLFQSNDGSGGTFLAEAAAGKSD